MLRHAVALCLICSGIGAFSQYDEIFINMLQSQVIPDVIPVGPRKTLYVDFPSAALEPGSKLSRNEIKYEPRVVFYGDPNRFYTLCLTEADIPTRVDPEAREYLRWLVINIPGSNVEAGETLVEYTGDSPFEGPGDHRNVFLLYAQPKRLPFNETYLGPSHFETRSDFIVFEFASIYKFHIPKEGNFFLTESQSSIRDESFEQMLKEDDENDEYLMEGNNHRRNNGKQSKETSDEYDEN